MNTVPAKTEGRLSTVFICALAALPHASPSSAQLGDVPEIMEVNYYRYVDFDVDADGENAFDVTESTSGGPFMGKKVSGEALGSQNSEASAESKQDTRISSFSISGKGSVTGDASLGGTEFSVVGSSAVSRMELFFSLPIDAPYTLSGDFTITGSGSICPTSAAVSFDLEHNRLFDCNSPPNNSHFEFSGVAQGGIVHGFAIEVSADLGGQAGEPFAVLGHGTASFEFILDFGDRDEDGLLDLWEEQGINFPGEGIEINLPELGANPDRKDLFVEIDVMDQVPIDPLSLILVAGAFAQAPAEMVDNPDGSPGINLHLIHDDGDVVPWEPIGGAGSCLEDGVSGQFENIKGQFLGSSGDRNHDWSSEILLAREKIFRYALWADTVVCEGTLLGGIGELPGNDFMVAAGLVGDRFPSVKSKAIAGAFMHELGHNLGLRHGGQNNVNFKPNYLSVMNYAYAIPLDISTGQGTNAQEAWRLDYSRSALVTLNETELREADGLDGPAGRLIIFNSSSENFPEPVVKTIAWAKSNVIDWNNNGGDPKQDSYQQDISRFSDSIPVEYQNSLQSFADWNQIWYHLSGDEAFEDRSIPRFNHAATGIDLDLLEEIQNLTWVDQTALGDLIFENGFELGSTTTWSDTVP